MDNFVFCRCTHFLEDVNNQTECVKKMREQGGHVATYECDLTLTFLDRFHIIIG